MPENPVNVPVNEPVTNVAPPLEGCAYQPLTPLAFVPYSIEFPGLAASPDNSIAGLENTTESGKVAAVVAGLDAFPINAPVAGTK